jgi:hypothetical protein
MEESVMTREELKKILRYEDGHLLWIIKPSKRVNLGDVAGCVNKISGYHQIIINKKKYYTHRLVFLYHKGYFPKFIDHIDCNRLNNRIENLRPCTKSENGQNMLMHKDNKSGVKGVYEDKHGNFIARSGMINGDRKYLGSYRTLSEAELVVMKHRESQVNKFINHGKVKV